MTDFYIKINGASISVTCPVILIVSSRRWRVDKDKGRIQHQLIPSYGGTIHPPIDWVGVGGTIHFDGVEGDGIPIIIPEVALKAEDFL